MMANDVVSAYLLKRGDVIRVDGEEGWYVVSSAFQEGTGGPIDLDLYSEADDFPYNWHVGPEHQVERRTEQI